MPTILIIFHIENFVEINFNIILKTSLSATILIIILKVKGNSLIILKLVKNLNLHLLMIPDAFHSTLIMSQKITMTNFKSSTAEKMDNRDS